MTNAALAILAVAFSPDSRWLVSGGQGELKVWDAAAAKLERRISGLEGRIHAIAFRPDGATLAVATGVPGRSGAVSLIDFAAGAVTRIASSTDEMLAAAFSPDGRFLAFGGTDHHISIWSMDERKTVVTIEEHTDWVQSLAFSPDGKLLASASADHTAGIWDATNWKLSFRLPLNPSDPVHAVAFSPESDNLAYASDEHALRIWRTQNAFVPLDPNRPGQRNTLMQTRPINLGPCVPLSLAWIKGPPLSRMVVACSDQTIRIVGPNASPFQTLPGHKDWVYAVAASPDGARVASAGGDGTIRLWNPAGKPLATLSGETRP